MKNELWYQQPAAYWNEALPLGNGRMGAMVFGGIKQEHIQVNEDSVWYGKKIDRLNTDAAANIGKIQKLIFENKMAESGNLSEMHEPLFKLIKKMVVNGQRTAREMYGCRGFVAHHNTDLYGDTEPQDKCITSAYIQAAGTLGREIDKEKAEHILASLPKPQIGKYGQLMEWIQDNDEFEEGHRHISHLFGLYPASQFTYEETPDLMEACEITLRRRLKSGSGYTGWSRAWIACFWIRLRNGNEVYENLKALLQESTFLNMMDNHPCQDERGEYKVFQIDGNLGVAAAIMDMFVQSIKDRVFLLPALPDCLKEGYVKGIIFIIHGKK